MAGLLAPSAVQAREEISADAGWRFHLGEVAGAEAAALDDAGWSAVELPHDWSIALPVAHDAPSLGGGGFFVTGIGWYRHAFNAPSTWHGQQVWLEFDGVYENATVWINGVQLGAHAYGYTPFRFDVTAAIKPGATNLLAVRVDNSAQPNCRWYSGSGIYRHVRFVVTNPVHVAPDGVFVRTTALTDTSATVRVDWTIRNDSHQPQEATVEAVVLEPTGHDAARTTVRVSVPAGAEAAVPATVEIPHPQPWSPITPVRYRLATRVSAGGTPVDQVLTAFGIRTVAVSAERGFELNGRPMKLVGGNVHHDNGPLGAAAFDRAEQRRVELMKAAGFNAIRTSHNPPSPAFLDACDRLGLLVLDEAFDGWEKPKTKFDYHLSFRSEWRRDLDAMVFRDRNHPSVVLWSIGNEMPERGNENGLRIARELTARIRELDPTRPITAGVNGPGKNGDWTKFDPLFATLDVAGYNYELNRHADDHARVPGRVIVVTESYQSETFANWAVAQQVPYVIGDFVWSGLDYLGEAGIGRVFPPGEKIVRHWEGDMWPWHGAACGDLDLIGDRKPISHYRAIVWDRGEKLYAAVVRPTPAGGAWGVSPWTVEPTEASWTWPGQEGRELEVQVYSRHASVRVYLNDRLVAEKPTTQAEEFRTTVRVPYAPGVLRVVGREGDADAESVTLTTAGAVAQVRLEPDRSVIHADGQDLVFVPVTLVDEHGRTVPVDDREVRYAVNGPAVLAAVGNADLTSFEPYVASPHRTFRGRALVVVRATHVPGIITLTASAPGLPVATATLQTNRR